MKLRRWLAAGAAALLAAGVLSGCGGAKKNYVVLEGELSSEEYGIGFRKDDAALRNEVWKILVDMNKSGEFKTISEKWFGEDVSKLPDSYEPEEATDDSLQKIKDKGKLVMGLDVALPPMGFRDEDGNITGFDIDLAKAVCEKMGVELELTPIIWENKEKELNDRKIDVVWNGMTINDERKAAMNMTPAYMGNRQVLVVMEGSDIQSKDDLEGKKLTLQKGSTASDALDAHPEIKEKLAGGEATKLDDNVTALLELAQGKCDVVLMDEVVARYYASHKNEIN